MYMYLHNLAYIYMYIHMSGDSYLLRSVDPIITYFFQDINDLVNRRSKERLIQIMLNGDQRLENQQNLRIFESVHCYVLATGRMKWL